MGNETNEAVKNKTPRLTFSVHKEFAHIIEEVDKLPNKSRFVCEAIQEKLQRMQNPGKDIADALANFMQIQSIISQPIQQQPFQVEEQKGIKATPPPSPSPTLPQNEDEDDKENLQQHNDDEEDKENLQQHNDEEKLNKDNNPEQNSTNQDGTKSGNQSSELSGTKNEENVKGNQESGSESDLKSGSESSSISSSESSNHKNETNEDGLSEIDKLRKEAQEKYFNNR